MVGLTCSHDLNPSISWVDNLELLILIPMHTPPPSPNIIDSSFVLVKRPFLNLSQYPSPKVLSAISILKIVNPSEPKLLVQLFFQSSLPLNTTFLYLWTWYGTPFISSSVSPSSNGDVNS